MAHLTQHVCFSCHKVFKKPFYGIWGCSTFDRTQPEYKCPDCDAVMVHMGYKFRAPKRTDIKSWQRIKDGIKLGTEWQVKTIRKKSKDERTLSPAMKRALGFRKAK